MATPGVGSKVEKRGERTNFDVVVSGIHRPWDHCMVGIGVGVNTE